MQKSKVAGRQLRALGQRVADLRKQKTGVNGRPLSQEQLADRMDVHRTYVGHIERGEVNMSFSNLLRLADALEVDPSELVQGLTMKPTKRPRRQGAS